MVVCGAGHEVTTERVTPSTHDTRASWMWSSNRVLHHQRTTQSSWVWSCGELVIKHTKQQLDVESKLSFYRSARGFVEKSLLALGKLYLRTYCMYVLVGRGVLVASRSQPCHWSEIGRGLCSSAAAPVLCFLCAPPRSY